MQEPQEHHGRKGQATEYYELDFPSPKFVTQRCGDHWIVGIIHIDHRWWFDNIQYPTAAHGRAVAREYALRYRDTGAFPENATP